MSGNRNKRFEIELSIRVLRSLASICRELAGLRTGKANIKARITLTHFMISRLEEEVDMLDRHLHVLKTIIANEPIGIVKTANELGYPHHKVRYSLRILEEAELIEPTDRGAVTTDQAELLVETLTEDLDVSIDKLDSMKTNSGQISQHS